MDIMVDLETMGLQPGCALLSIGGVAFDLYSEALGDTFYCNIRKESCVRHGMFIDPQTELWWAQQSEDAKRALMTPDPIDLDMAFYHFIEWVKTHDPASVRIWSHGAGFDLPMLHDAARRLGFSTPWSYRNERDTRTVLHLVHDRRGPDTLMEILSIQKGVHHHALDDAVTQAKQIQKGWAALI